MLRSRGASDETMILGALQYIWSNVDTEGEHTLRRDMVLAWNS
jgi:hypothetical protein